MKRKKTTCNTQALLLQETDNMLTRLPTFYATALNKCFTSAFFATGLTGTHKQGEAGLGDREQAIGKTWVGMSGNKMSERRSKGKARGTKQRNR